MTDEPAVRLPDVTEDNWYNSTLSLIQPAKGFRATTDALLLAASVPNNAQHPIELGAGLGAALLPLATRLPGIPITAVELDPVMVTLLRQNIARNGMQDRITTFHHDALDASPPWQGQHDVALINPPYNDAASSQSDNFFRKTSMATQDLSAWVDAAERALAPKGRAVIISRADRLDELMAALAPSFGDISLRAIHGNQDAPAKRILLTARKNLASKVAILPPLVMNGDDGALSSEMARISFERGAIDLIPEGRDVAKTRLPRQS